MQRGLPKPELGHDPSVKSYSENRIKSMPNQRTWTWLLRVLVQKGCCTTRSNCTPTIRTQSEAKLNELQADGCLSAKGRREEVEMGWERYNYNVVH